LLMTLAWPAFGARDLHFARDRKRRHRKDRKPCVFAAISL
jgi:hypothetical protein